MIAGHSGVNRYGGLERYAHIARHVGRGGLVRMPAPLPNLPGPIKEGIKTFLGTSTRKKMPSRTKRPTKLRRKKFYRRRRRAVQPYSIVRKLKTVANFAIDTGAGVTREYYKLNSAFDPSGSVSANQPLGFDQYTSLYNRYCVVNYAVKLEFVTTDNTHPIVVGHTPSTSSTALASFSHYKESPGTTSMVLTPDIDKGRLFTRGKIKPFLLPRGGKYLTDDDVNALVTADPSKILYGHVWAQPMDTTSDPATVRIIATIYQTVVFYDPVIPSRS